jgi:8-oxo-dGTP pyrophosphatase MutT (NUDIX family)
MSGLVTPFSPIWDLEPWIRRRLQPVEAYDRAAGRVRSDIDLNPDWPRPAGPFHPAAVLVPLVEREEGLTVLLTLRSDGLRRHSGQIAFPGGRADPGEAPWETALREAEEEVGLERSQVRIVGLGDLYETVSGFSITPVVGFVSPGFVPAPQESEVAEVFETPFAFLMDPGNHERRSRDFGDGMKRHYYAMAHQERTIWGATAGMLRSLYQRLFVDEV